LGGKDPKWEGAVKGERGRRKKCMKEILLKFSKKIKINKHQLEKNEVRQRNLGSPDESGHPLPRKKSFFFFCPTVPEFLASLGTVHSALRLHKACVLSKRKKRKL